MTRKIAIAMIATSLIPAPLLVTPAFAQAPQSTTTRGQATQPGESVPEQPTKKTAGQKKKTEAVKRTQPKPKALAPADIDQNEPPAGQE
jgi:hypothetical protein